MNALTHIKPTSKRIGKKCCPKCRSISLRERETYWACRHCKFTFARPDRVRVIKPGRASAKNAGRVFYRGLNWNVGAYFI